MGPKQVRKGLIEALKFANLVEALVLLHTLTMPKSALTKTKNFIKCEITEMLKTYMYFSAYLQ